MTRAAGLILAAGLSSRFAPEFKPLADLGGASLLARCAGTFRAAGVTELLCVCGHRAEEVRAEARRLELPCVDNPDYAGGMFTSVRAGVAAAPAGIEVLLMLPVDIPLIRPAVVRALLERYAEAPAAVLHPVFDGLRGHPPLVAARHLPRILGWSGADGLLGAIGDLERRFGAAEVPVADRNILFDVDTREDLLEARRRFARRGIPTPGEALALLRLHNAGERGLAHARGVARAALAMAAALNRKGLRLDPELAESAALLHDIAKGRKFHEQAGGALLAALGYEPVARIVEAHRDIAPADAPEITERELVYLADKLVRGSQPVSVEARFGEKLDAYAHDPEACAAIRRRLANALDMRRRVEAAAGTSLERILAGEDA